jgi:hypothetical protein
MYSRRRRLPFSFGKSTLPLLPFLHPFRLHLITSAHLSLFFFFFYPNVLFKNEKIPLIHLPPPSFQCYVLVSFLSFYFAAGCRLSSFTWLSVLMDPTWLPAR